MQTNFIYTSDDDSDYTAAVPSDELNAAGHEFPVDMSHESPIIDDNDAPGYLM